MTDFDALTAANLKRWANAKLTRTALGMSVAKRLFAAKSRYQAVEERTGVPWFVIAVIHERESSQNWSRSLAQGDPWNAVSTHVPAGRGPFLSWEEAAIDALEECAPYLGRRKDWSLAGVLVALEMYNGLGYFNRGVPSPYLWAGTDQYKAGKYVADGKYDPNAVDQQMGCAALILALMALDQSITLDGIAPVKVAPPPSATEKPAPVSVTNPAPGSIGAWVASFFKRKA
jgi:lysozyme family protein